MTDILRTLVVTAADAPLARQIAETLSPAGVNMWLVGLSADGQEPATHYVSTGLIGEDFAAMVPCTFWAYDSETSQWVETGSEPGDAAMVSMACAAAEPPLVVTEAEVQAVMDASDISDQEPFTAFSRMGLTMIQQEI
jgi:hypothetical protein